LKYIIVLIGIVVSTSAVYANDFPNLIGDSIELKKDVPIRGFIFGPGKDTKCILQIKKENLFVFEGCKVVLETK
jgi:hypothetical protein